jgi:hypothetical protein
MDRTRRLPPIGSREFAGGAIPLKKQVQPRPGRRRYRENLFPASRAATASCARFCAAARLRPDGTDSGRTRFGDDLGNRAMVARRHDVSAAYCRDLREFLQQFDTDPLSLGFRVAGSCEPVD